MGKNKYASSQLTAPKTALKKNNALKSSGINMIAIAVMTAVVALVIYGGILPDARAKYVSGIFITICINVILAVSLNLTTGCLGEFALGHAGFMSVGAYGGALFAKAMPAGMPDLVRYLLAIIVGGLVAAVFGVIVGIPALRLRGDYLAIITLGFGEIIRVLIEFFDFTGGAIGLRKVPKYSNAIVIFILTVIVIALLFTLMRSRHGRAITSIREDEIAASSSGISVTFYKVFTFTLSAFFAGVAGAIYAQYIGSLGASTFNFNRSIEILVYVVLGGLGSFTGSIISAAGLTILPEVLRVFNDYRMVLYSLALIVIMLFKPSGLLGRYEFSLTKALGKIKSLFSSKGEKLPKKKKGETE